ncbi:MAG: hypothetical protein M3Z05_22780, partial [Gemmatimonadota bacterium]|nr:hypothetical protein [Gemmatimonadota bacterium]
MTASRPTLASSTREDSPRNGAGRAAAAVGAPLDRTAFAVRLHTATLSRTLLAAGFAIKRARRQPGHIEISCERRDVLGASIPYLLVVCEGDRPPTGDLPNIMRTAARAGQVVVIVAQTSGPEWLSWTEFLAALGGAVPTWRALSGDYASVLRTVAKTELPTGMIGEAWEIFEEATADGLEFLFGRRVRRMGGARRGQRVSDIVALTPDERVLVVDAKASAKKYDVTWPRLRPLVEYVKAQKARQKGQLDVGGAVVVAGGFKHSNADLMALAGEFFAETNVPITFVDVDVLLALVGRMTERPDLRNAVAWVKLFCRGGRLMPAHVRRELDAADAERMASEA